MGITNCWNCNGTGWVLDMPCNQPGCNGAEREVEQRAWDRVLSYSEVQQLSADPLAPFRRRRIQLTAPATAPVSVVIMNTGGNES